MSVKWQNFEFPNQPKTKKITKTKFLSFPILSYPKLTLPTPQSIISFPTIYKILPFCQISNPTFVLSQIWKAVIRWDDTSMKRGLLSYSKTSKKWKGKKINCRRRKWINRWRTLLGITHSALLSFPGIMETLKQWRTNAKVERFVKITKIVLRMQKKNCSLKWISSNCTGLFTKFSKILN